MMPKRSSITNSEGAKTLAWRCCIFFIPILAGLAFTVGTLGRAGELMSPDEVAKTQLRSQVVYLPQFQEWPRFFPRYLFRAITLRRPKILVFGSSRVKAIRSTFFREPAAALNAGIPVTTVSVGTWRNLLESLPPDYAPRVILMDLDPWWFREGASIAPGVEFQRTYSSMEILDFAWRRGFWWSVDQFRSPSERDGRYLGVQAIDTHEGVRPDGSFFLPPSFHPARESSDFQRELLRGIHAGKWPWVHDSPKVSSVALNELKRFLDYCRIRGIRVVGFISSLRPDYYAAVEQEPHLGYLRNVHAALESVFERTDHAIFDYLDPSGSGCPEQSFTDYLHESDVCSVRTLIKMAEQNEVAASAVDQGALRTMLQNRKSEWQLN